MSEAELNKLVYEAQVYRQQGQQLQEQIAQVAASVNEALSALDALKALKEKPEVSMVPLGSGVYVKGGKINAQMVLVGVGANILMEKPIDEAIETLEKRIDSSKQLSAQLDKALIEINSRLEKVDTKARRIIEDEGGADVRASKE
ncbi:prefoldin subunit alpha [Candidatus Parvarchaeota archaeon]|nr:prefoldin subunit alpha [Candidatus Parvarchaeota archaeon]